MNRIKTSYSKSGSRGAPGVSTIAVPSTVEAFVRDEALSNSEDIAVSLGMAIFFHDVGIDKVTSNGVSIDKFGDQKDEGVISKIKKDFGDISDIGCIPQYIESAVNWSVELIMCYQVKPLNRDNVKNYFKGCGVTISSTDFILKFLKVASSKFPKLVEDSDIRGKAMDNKFVKNHTSYASSGSLVCRAIDELGQLSNVLFSKDEITNAANARDAPYDSKVSETVTKRSMGVTYVYMDTNKILPDNWYQGTSAYDEMPPNNRRALRAFFKRIGTLTADVDKMDASTDIGELISMLPANLRFA